MRSWKCAHSGWNYEPAEIDLSGATMCVHGSKHAVFFAGKSVVRLSRDIQEYRVCLYCNLSFYCALAEMVCAVPLCRGDLRVVKIGRRMCDMLARCYKISLRRVGVVMPNLHVGDATVELKPKWAQSFFAPKRGSVSVQCMCHFCIKYKNTGECTLSLFSADRKRIRAALQLLSKTKMMRIWRQNGHTKEEIIRQTSGILFEDETLARIAVLQRFFDPYGPCVYVMAFALYLAALVFPNSIDVCLKRGLETLITRYCIAKSLRDLSIVINIFGEGAANNLMSGGAPVKYDIQIIDIDIKLPAQTFVNTIQAYGIETLISGRRS